MRAHIARIVLAACAAGCGARSSLLGGELDASVDGPPNASVPDGCSIEAGPACTGLQCQGVVDNCACHGKPPTTISGVVYDPAGLLPVYNVYVYIPNATPDAIQPGNPTCTPCQAPISGSPIIGASTDANGAFTLTRGPNDAWPVPSGDNVPLVLQIGKWRRQLTIPHVEACTANHLPDDAPTYAKLRLPANGFEGDMPLMAFTSGCDAVECFLRRIGINDTEFVPPGSPNGHVHFFTGRDVSATATSGSGVQGGNSSVDTYNWWQSSANLLKYDVIVNSCECEALYRGPGGYAAMHEYLTGGGRLFAGHFFYNWFAPPDAPPDFQGIVDWVLPETNVEQPYANFFVDTSFPKGKSFADWLSGNGLSPTYGQIALDDTRYAMNGVKAGSTRWLYNADAAGDSKTATMFMGLNTPVDRPGSQQCGRAVLNEMHVVAAPSDDSVFPVGCLEADPFAKATLKEKALEFLFFDLLSCVQDDAESPIVPPMK